MDNGLYNQYAEMLRDSLGGTTGNKGYDVLFGGLSGLGQALEPVGTYYSTAQYKGNGLANTGIGYMKNPNYRNYDDMRRMLGSWYQLSGRGKKSQNNSNWYRNILGKLSGLKGNLGDWASIQFANGQVGDFTYPSDGFGADRFITPNNKYIA